MKKIFSAFVIAVCCMFMAMPAQAQLLKWGVKGGVNMTKIDWDGGIILLANGDERLAFQKVEG